LVLLPTYFGSGDISFHIADGLWKFVCAYLGNPLKSFIYGIFKVSVFGPVLAAMRDIGLEVLVFENLVS